MHKLIEGKALVLGKNIDTDQIYPGRYLAETDPQKIGTFCLSGVDESIAKNFNQGDIVVAGRNFGCGSSREHAPISLINMGASVVVAESFARIFFRNSINLGLPLIICPDISKNVETGDQLRVDIENGTVTNITKNEIYQSEKLGDFVLNILESGGIKPLFKKGKFSI